MEFDVAVLDCFIENQLKLYPKRVCETREEAGDFLEEVMAVVVESIDEVWEYFDEAGLDTEDLDEQSIIEADEVFDIGDGRYLIVEA